MQEHNKKNSRSFGTAISYGYLMLTAIFIFFICSGMGFFPYNNESDPEFGSLVGGRILYNSMFLAMLSGLVLFYRHTLAALLNYKLLTALIAVYFLTITASINAHESLLFSIRIAIFVTYFALLASIMERQHLWRLLVGFFALFSLANFLYIAAMPHYGLMAGVHEGAWRGLFSHKNQFGYFCAYAAILSALWAVNSAKFRHLLIATGLLVLNLLMLIKSDSGGAIVATSFGLLACCTLLYNRRIHATMKTAWLFVVGLACVAIVPFFYTLMEAVLELLGRDPTLTNRSAIWALYIDEYFKSPILGLGANAYHFDADLKMKIQAALNVDTFLSPHNGYLDILLQTGAVGLFVYLLLAGRIVWAGIAASLTGGHATTKLLAVFTIMHLVRGIVETNGSIQLSIYFALMVMAYASFYAPAWKRKPVTVKSAPNGEAQPQPA